jgi:hypothetical protein
MKARALLTGLAVLLLLGADDPPALKEFAPKDGGFTVRAPGDMKETVKTVKGPGGKDEVQRTYTYAPNANTVYLILDREMPALARANAATVQMALENGRKAAEKSLSGKLIDSKDVKLGEHQGLEFLIDSAKQGYYRSRIYIVNGRMYQVTIMAPKDVATSKTADEYLESFKLKEKE